MIKNRLYLIPLTAILFTACNFGKPTKVKPDITRDTLTYTYQQIKQRADDCGTKADNTGCSYVDINYPEFASQSALNDTVTRAMLTLFDSGDDNNLKTAAKNFIAEYDEYKRVMKKKPEHPFNLMLSATVTRQDSSLITIEVTGSSFSGNQHPIASTRFLNWNTKTEKPITLEDIFRKGYEKDFNTIAEKIFRKQENLKDTSSLARDYFFKDNKFALNNNFLITPVGIRFLYNQYEIKPYAAGITDLFIPYTQIQHLLKPNTVVAQYIKH
ncbi:MAG: DUF3298 domain-containing protein [Mucilaginibacter sp.]|uniref:DUF3298 and DUF4163 domain-containing protein n=1 Tax=Mucilaginibacter sp. TaxID=1882438 RepID=UPI0032647E5F